MLLPWDTRDRTGGDAAKVVTSSGSCSDSAAGGTSEVTDLGPDNTDGVTQAEAGFTFTVAGDYKVCYKLAGGSYAQVGSSTLTVAAVAPTAFSDDGAVTTGSSETITFLDGNGLNLLTGGDSSKIVSSNDTCAYQVAGGTSEVTDLGPDNSQGSVNATAAFSFTIAGSYKVCYKVAGENDYRQVGAELLIVLAVPPIRFHLDGVVFASQLPLTEYVYIDLHGGSGMNLGSGKDTLKVIDWHIECAANPEAAGGSSEV